MKTLRLCFLPLSIFMIASCAIPWGPESTAFWRTGATLAEGERDYDYCERLDNERIAKGGEPYDRYFNSCMEERGYELIWRFHCGREDLEEGFVPSGSRPLPPAGDVLCLKPTEPRGYVIREGLNYTRAQDYFTETGNR